MTVIGFNAMRQRMFKYVANFLLNCLLRIFVPKFCFQGSPE